MIEAWSTREQVAAAREEFEAALGPAWRRPAAWGVLHDGGDGRIMVDRANLDEHVLPAVVLAGILGYTSGSCSIRFTAADLDRAIEQLSPAEAWTEVVHYNLNAWRYLHEEIGAAGSAVAAFAGEIDIVEPDDPYLGALLDAVHHGRQENPDGTTTLWRPVGPAELELLRACGMRAWPPRLPEQPIFYPVLNEAYARRIAAEWNVAASGSGFVLRFALPTAFARRYPTRQAGGREMLELWIPAEDLDEVNRQLVGPIEVVDVL
jgi:hypothetical protein